ncbi:hypothetical protein [Sinorhizobium psoraleae]|uniref:Uncharacterized protein n=1 Tax=Sinorhizobium psoraleae TaxID=520838 RepID=A0ABT4KAV3_9HYPH|nr:hypothetical protein [Sinorhizobium psoraleae]MCZ4089089.1 hypothetical protein [Sinorhizobium psoraleae]
MPKSPNPKDPDRMHVKLLFGLFEGSATGPTAVTCIFVLGVLVLIGRATGLL